MNESLYWEALRKVSELTNNNMSQRNNSVKKITLVIESYTGYLSEGEIEHLYTLLNSYIRRQRRKNI